MKKNAFTLAEVLSTLAIIGVVTALTIPVIRNQSGTESFRVSANKALSSVTDSMTMRASIDDTTFADYVIGNVQGALTRYLFEAPEGETKPVLPAQSVNKYWYKLKNGMLFQSARNVSLTSGNAAINGNSCLAFEDSTCLVYVDTNGSGGPSRRNGEAANDAFNIYCGRSRTSSPDGVVEFPRNGDNATRTPATNSCPDVVGFLIDVNTGTVTPANQRTRNILATGNARTAE